jgi:hypothetical protein
MFSTANQPSQESERCLNVALLRIDRPDSGAGTGLGKVIGIVEARLEVHSTGVGVKELYDLG